MSPRVYPAQSAFVRFPRVSGDEPPELEGCYYMNVFSPREWG